MTIEIKVKCDGRGCHAEREIEDLTERDVERTGFHTDDRTGFNYCQRCWPKIEKERASVE